MTSPLTRGFRGVRTRITALATLVLLVVLVVAGLAVLRLFEDELLREVDARLHSVSERVAQLAPAAERLPDLRSPEDLVQVLDQQGDVVLAGDALAGEPALWQPGDGDVGPRTVHSEGAGDLRAIAVPFQESWVILADPLQPVHDDVASLRRTMLLTAVPLLFLLAAGVWIVVGRALRPVAAAVEREEQLVADVSHELRNPQAGLRVLLETEPDGPQAVQLNRIEALATLTRLETITDQLLELSYHERSRGPSGQPVDLDEVVLDQVRALAPDTATRVDASAVGAGQVRGRPAELASLVGNLLANGIRHARSAVRLTVREEASTVTLLVEDDGPGIDAEQRDLVFERFTRLDEARSRAEGGAGLGLAIARAIAETHGGTISVGDSALGGACFTVRLPAGTPSEALR